MKWNEISIITISEAVEAMSYKLTEIGIKGIEIKDPNDIIMQDKNEKQWDYIEDELLEQYEEGKVIIKCYISEEENLNEYIDKIKEIVKDTSQYLNIGEGKIEINNVDEEEWANKWKQYYKPFKLGNKIVIKPTWEQYQKENEDEIIIEMDPGMAFGTGTHETTSMCIQLIEENIKKRQKVLDIGCGSGILGIVAAKLGATKVVGVDIDANAVRVAKENVQVNHVKENVEIRLGNLLDVVNNKAELIVANIIADIIIDMSGIVADFLEIDGRFIASGIIQDRLDDVQKELSTQGFIIEKIIKKGEWAALVAKVL